MVRKISIKLDVKRLEIWSQIYYVTCYLRNISKLSQSLVYLPFRGDRILSILKFLHL